MRKLSILAMIALWLGAAPALALSDKPYLADSDADFANLIPPPPADGSLRDKFDLQTVLALQKGVTPEMMAQIHADTTLTVYQVAGEVLGPTFTKERFPAVGALLEKVNKDSGVGVGAIKRMFKRKRPFQVSDQVQTPPDIAKASGGPTYPSGHATFGAEVTTLLSMMVPEKRTELYARGWQFGTQRLLSGVAYPSDIEGGRAVAMLLVALMLQKPEFRADFDAAKTELRKGLNLAP